MDQVNFDEFEIVGDLAQIFGCANDTSLEVRREVDSVVDSRVLYDNPMSFHPFIDPEAPGISHAPLHQEIEGSSFVGQLVPDNLHNPSVFPRSIHSVNGTFCNCIDGSVAESLMTCPTFMSPREGISFGDGTTSALSANPFHWSHRVCNATGFTIAEQEQIPSHAERLNREPSAIGEPSTEKKRGPGRPKGSSSKYKPYQPKARSAGSIELTAQVIRIGCWEKISKFGCDLSAKFYFGKRQLVWEFYCTETSRKKRIVLDWKNISKLNAFVSVENYEILRVELSQAPKFYKEKDSRRGVHSDWDPCDDFTSGEAIVSRIHELKFRPGKLMEKFNIIMEKSLELQMLNEKWSPIPNETSTFISQASVQIRPTSIPVQIQMTQIQNQLEN